MTDSNDVEYSRLSESVQAMEKLLSDPVAAAKLGFIAKALLLNTRGQLEAVKQQQALSKEHAKEEERLARDSVAVAQMVERESKLNAEEKQEYASFLKQDYFTKANFGDLDHFYQNSWDKLSESGKEQMSIRVWEGIKQGEYTFAELPQVVQDKESKRLYEKLKNKDGVDAGLASVPEQSRADFIQAYENHDKKAVAQVLSRDDFPKKETPSSVVSLRDTTGTKENKPAGTTHDAHGETQAASASAGIDASCISGFSDSVPVTNLPKPTGDRTR